MGADALRASDQAADDSFSTNDASQGAVGCPLKCYIELEVLHADGTPAAGEEYWVKTSLGDLKRGELDENGFARVEKIPCEPCEVRFPNIDDDDWELEPGAGTDWIDLELIDTAGEPLANERYEVEDLSGTKHEGSLDASGCARVEGLPKGVCVVRFPDIDELAWEGKA